LGIPVRDCPLPISQSSRLHLIASRVDGANLFPPVFLNSRHDVGEFPPASRRGANVLKRFICAEKFSPSADLRAGLTVPFTSTRAFPDSAIAKSCSRIRAIFVLLVFPVASTRRASPQGKISPARATKRIRAPFFPPLFPRFIQSNIPFPNWFNAVIPSNRIINNDAKVTLSAQTPIPDSSIAKESQA